MQVQESRLSNLESLILKLHNRLSVLDKNRSWVEVKPLLQRIATSMLELTYQKTPPVDLNPICELRLVNKVYTNAKTSQVIQLYPHEKGFILQLERNIPEVRERTIIAHEIGHTLFYDMRTLPPKRIFSYRYPNESEHKEEWLAYDFARFLLLPEFMLRGSIPEKDAPPAPKDVLVHTRRYRVSYELYCHRVIRDLGLWKNAVCFAYEAEPSNGQFRRSKIYKGRNLRKLRVGGSSGLLAANKTLLHSLVLESALDRQAKSSIVEYKGIPYFLEVYTYMLQPQRSVCMLKGYYKK